MKKKMYFILMALLLSFTFNACSSDSPEEELPKKEEPEQPEKPVEPNEPQNGDVILNENTILLSDELEKYVTNTVTGTSLNIDASIKESDLPEIGRILLYGAVSEKFPSGFLGKVKQVVKAQGGYEIQTESVSLEEAFDKLYINEPMELVFDDMDVPDSRSILPCSPYWDKDGYVGLQTRWNIEFGKASEKEWSSTTTDSGSLSGSMESGAGIGIKLQCRIDIDKKAQKEPYIEFSFFCKTFYGSSFDVKGALSREYRKKIKKIPVKPTLLPSGVVGVATQIVLQPEFILSAFMNFEGEFEYHSEQHSQQEWKMSFIYEHGESRFESQRIKDNEELSVKSLQLDGTISAGLSLDFSMKLFNNKEISCMLGASAAPSIAAEISYEQEDLNNIYSKLKDSKITETACNVTAQIAVKTSLFVKKTNIEVELEREFLSLPIGKKDYYLFPEFEPIDAIWKGDKIDASYHVNRDVFFPIELGLRLLDEKKKKVEDSEEKIEYRLSGSSPVELTTSFSSPNKNKNYCVCPTIKLPIFDEIILALPEQEIEGITLVTGDATVQNKTTALVTCEYKNVIPWTKKIGVEFTDESGKRQEIVRDIIEDGIYNFQLTGLQSKMTYTYRAFAIVDGEHVYADNFNSFTTSEVLDIKDVDFEIIPSFKNSWPDTTELLDYNITFRESRYLKFWYDIFTNDVQKLQGVSKWGTILYKNGIVCDTHTGTRKDVSFNVLRCDETDLTIHNSTYTAIADKAIYSIGIFVERTDSLGKTVVETTKPKQIEPPIYSQKPEIVISSIEKILPDAIIGDWYDDNGVHQIQKQIYSMLKYRVRGLFWMKPIRGNDEGINIVHNCPLDEAYYESGLGPSYYNNQRPQTVCITAKDLTTGKIITSNVVNIP